MPGSPFLCGDKIWKLSISPGWLKNKSTYHREIDEATQEMWENFKVSYEEDTALAHQPY